MFNSFFVSLQTVAVQKRTLIIRLFQFVYMLIGIYIGVASYSFSVENNWYSDLASISSKLGQIAIILFLLVTLPGILGRFGIKHPLITIGIAFRRFMGILVSFLVIAHAMVIHTIPSLFSGFADFFSPTYVIYGFIANLMLMALMFTSNNWSVKKLGKNWKRLHRLVYVIFWFIFIHVALQGSITWSLIIGAGGVLELVSLVYDYLKKKNINPNGSPSVASTVPVVEEKKESL